MATSSFLKPTFLWCPWPHSILIFFPPSWPPLFSYLYWFFLFLVTSKVNLSSALRLLSLSSAPMALNDIHMSRCPGSCLWLLHQPPHYSLNWYLCSAFCDQSTRSFASSLKVLLLHALLLPRDLKQTPCSQVCACTHRHTMFAPRVLRWLVFSLQFSTVVYTCSGKPSPIPQGGCDSCLPGHLRRFGITCLFIFMCLFWPTPIYLSHSHLHEDSVSFTHHYIICCYMEGFNISGFKTVIFYIFSVSVGSKQSYFSNRIK